jgi:DmsE family decaheme c-type cytochrome
MRQVRFATMLAGLVALLVGSGAFTQAAAQASWSASDCEACHEKAYSPAFAKSAHAQATQSCAKCHNNVAEHYKAQSNGEKGPVPTLKGVKAQDLNARCLTCHEKNNQMSYDGSKHARRNVACISCHSVHSPKSVTGQLKTKTDVETCVTCHKTERAKMNRTSHHPVREGKMGCSSCHNPHEGNRPKMLRAESVNDLCFTCHTEKRGPYLFEHAPVREDCVSCHDVHGSNHQRLLIQKLPTLCWNCHLDGGGHFSQTSDNHSTEKGGVAVAPGAPNPVANTNVARGSRWTGRSCLNCHLTIHGSNSPSGAYFVR